MRINLGSGSDIKEGYINIDIRCLPGVDIVADVRNLPFKNGSVDEITALDIYEHIAHHESQKLLVHWVSVLKTGGLLYIRGPCINRIIQYFLVECLDNNNSNLSKIERLIDNIFGSQDYLENLHRTTIHPDLMYYYLKQAGITGVIERQLEGHNIKIRAYK